MPRKKFTTYLDEQNIERVKILAVKEKCTVADILNQLLAEYLEKAEK